MFTFLFGYLRALPYIVYDMFRKKDVVEDFNRYARIDIVVGKTGAGKTLSSIALIKRLKKRFPEMRVISNVSSPLVDERLDRDNFLAYSDDIELVYMDEGNTTFPAKLKSDVDEAVRFRATQNRKGKGRYLLISAQDYSMIDTNFRKLATYVYDVKTYSGRLTMFRRFFQEDYETFAQAGGLNTREGAGKKVKRLSIALVQTKKIRALYDYKEKVPTDWHRKKKAEL